MSQPIPMTPLKLQWNNHSLGERSEKLLGIIYFHSGIEWGQWIYSSMSSVLGQRSEAKPVHQGQWSHIWYRLVNIFSMQQSSVTNFPWNGVVVDFHPVLLTMATVNTLTHNPNICWPNGIVEYKFYWTFPWCFKISFSPFVYKSYL